MMLLKFLFSDDVVGRVSWSEVRVKGGEGWIDVRSALGSGANVRDLCHSQPPMQPHLSLLNLVKLLFTRLKGLYRIVR